MTLVVFFTRGMSLEGWRRAGIFDRELALYRALRPHLDRLSFVTYGGARDLELAKDLPGIDVLANVGGLPVNLYSVMAPWLHRRALRRATVFKTNQINGAWSAVIAKRLFGRALLVRCGFLWADFVARLTASGLRRAIASRLERWAFRAADQIIVAAPADAAAVIDRYRVARDRVHVIPNYVDTERFRPMPEIPKERDRVTFVGRLDAQKNVHALLEALDGLAQVTLVMIGDGPLRAELETRARARRLNVQFLGTRPHDELPQLLNRSSIFILPSLYEGNPKALVEAMACGVPVIGSRSPGIRDVLVHEETGYLCGTSPAEIRAALHAVLGNAALRDRLSQGALSYARTHCSLAAAAGRELSLLRGLAGATA